MNNPISTAATLVGAILFIYIAINTARNLNKSTSGLIKKHLDLFFIIGPIVVCIILDHTKDIQSIVEMERGVFDSSTGFSTVYSPAYKFSYMESFLGLYVAAVLAFIVLISFVIPFLKVKLEKSLNQPFLSECLSKAALFVLAALIIVNVFIQYGKNKDKVFNYENYYDFEQIKLLEGTLLTVHELQSIWPGSLLTGAKKETGSFWTITNIKIDKNTLKFIDLDWHRSRKFGMPECFVGDFTELFTPYIGKNIVLRYYKTVTNSHPSDEEICLVELKVKSNIIIR